MRLKKEYTKNITRKPPLRHNKTSSLDVISSKTKNIYLNKIIQNNLGPQTVNPEKNNIHKNIPNFQSSIQNILSDEETRQKAKNYVIQMRNKQAPLSPIPNGPLNKNSFSNTNDRFYDALQKNLPYPLPKYNNYIDNNNNERENKRENMYNQNILYPEYNNNNYININDQGNSDRTIKVNKINRFYNEIHSYNLGEDNNNIYYKNNIGIRNYSRGNFNYNNKNNINNYKNDNSNIQKNSNTNYPLGSNSQKNYNNNKYIEINQNKNYFNNRPNNYIYNDDKNSEKSYKDKFEYNKIETNSLRGKINSGLKEIVVDNISEIYQSPEDTYNKKDEYTYELNSNIRKKDYNINSYNKYNNISNNISKYSNKN